MPEWRRVTIKALSSEQEEAIRNLIREENRRVRNTSQRPREGAIDHEEFPAPEVYIARVPASGIPGLQEHLTWTGTGTSTGTGSGTTFGDDEPGYAECLIYRVLPDADDRPRLKLVSGETKRVYNLGIAEIPGRSWVKISRDKYETWLVDRPGGDVCRFLTVVSNVCPDYTATGTSGHLSGIVVEYSIYDMFTCERVLRWCVNSP